MKRLLTAYLLLYSCFVYGQQPVTGLLKNRADKPVSNTTVLLKNGQGRILRFAHSDAQGRYAIPVEDTLLVTSLYLEVSSLNHKQQRQQLQEGKKVYDFVLEEKVIDLPEVKARNRPQLTTSGDTLHYNVSSFAREEDRSIGDVMRRLPGVSVADNGQIFLNGKAISNLYIQDDDLMDGRYGLATKVIKKEMIKTIDVIMNHQPLKVLKDKVVTDNVAINLVLKDENSLKLSGQAMLGAGFPKQYDAALNTMLFNKKFKMLNSVKANNSGVVYNDDFAQFGASNFLNTVGNTRPQTLLYPGTAGHPDLPRSNYYLNRSGVVNANNLVNTAGGLQLKSNVQVFLDRSTFDYSRVVENYLDGDTVRYSEQQSALRKPWLVNTALHAMLNKTRYFLNNTLRFNFAGESNSSSMDLNGMAFDQRLRERTYDFSNDLSWIPAIKNTAVMEFRWYINHYTTPQRLAIARGLNADVLNNGIPYAAIDQWAETPTLFSNASVSYRNTKEHLIRQTYEAGVLNETQQLNSTLNLVQQNGNSTAFTGDAGNALRWRRDRVYINPSYYLRKTYWEANLSVPLTIQSIRYRQTEYNLDSRQQQFFINPVARLKFFLNAEDYIVLNYSYNNHVGNIAGVYRGSILTNYRSLSANDAALQEKFTSGTGMQYSLQRSIVMLFINAGITYNKVKANTILSSILTNNVQRTILLPYENDQSNLLATAGVSKYIFPLNSTVSLKAVLNRSWFDQFINDERLPFINRSFSVNGNIESKILKKITLSYNGTVFLNKSRRVTKESISTSMRRFDQYGTLGYSPVSNLFINLRMRHSYTEQADLPAISYLFADVNIRYKLVKWRTDIEFDVTNLANIKNYELLSLSSQQLSVSRYAIRNRMAILRATFNL